MASRVNTKFVVLLAAALFVLFVGVAGLAVLAQLRSGDRLVRQGDAAMALGEYEQAARKYSRAVNKDQSRSDWFLKWRDALLQTIPKTPGEYQKAYSEHYMGLLSRLAFLNPTDPDHQLAFIEEYDQSLRAGGASLAALQNFATAVDERLQQLDPADPRTIKLRAYRARAVVDEMLRIQIDEEKAEQALEDLRAAVKNDPEDWRSALAISQWHYALVMQHRRDVRQALADRAMAKYREELAALMAEYGSQPEIQTFNFRILLIEGQRLSVSTEDRRALAEELLDDALLTLDALDAVDPASLSREAIGLTSGLVAPYAGEEGLERLITLLTRVEEARPDDPEVILLLGQALAGDRRYAEAYDVLDGVVELPDLPVSLDGLRLPAYRRGAVQAQVDLLLAQYEQTQDASEKEQFLSDARARRDVLAGMTDVSNEGELKLRDAQIALIEGDNAQAVLLLEEVRRSLQEDDPRIQRMMALAFTRQGNLGDAARMYERLVASGNHGARDLALLGDIRLQLNDTGEALTAFRQGLRMDPENEYLQRRVNAILTATGEVETGATLDPIVGALVRARRLTSGGDIEEATRVLEEAAEMAPGDIRLVRELVARDLASDRRDRALERIEAALALRPGNRDLIILKEQTSTDNPVEAAEAIIDSLDDLTPLQKAIQRYYVYERNGMSEEADAAFVEAERIDPESPAVIEIGFLRALTRSGEQGFDEAARYVARASEKNIDKLGGLTFKGRLELARGDAREAEVTFQRSVERMPYDPMSWRYLSQAQRMNGKVEAAFASVERAYQGRPGHAGIAEDYARTLMANRRGEEALEVVRRLLSYGSRSPRVVGLWLDLEANYGDREQALTTRQSIFENDPGNVSNSVAYLNLLLADERYEDFEQAVGSLDGGEAFTALQIAGLRSRGLAVQDRVDEGRTLLNAHIASVPENEVTVEAYMTLGRYEREYGTIEGAISAYEKARSYEDADLREADRALGDLLFAVAQNSSRVAEQARRQDPSGVTAEKPSQQAREYYTRASESYRRVYEADSTAVTVAKRLAETLIRLERYQDADMLLSSLEADDLQVFLLRAIIAQKAGDIRTARDQLNRAVELYPNDPVPYYRRAELNMGEETLFPDVIADLNQATKLRPAMVEAWGLRFMLYRARGQDSMDEAFAQLRSAVEANPDNNSLKVLLIEMLRTNGRAEDAKAIAQQIANENWDNAEWLERAALLSYQRRSYDEARRYYFRLYELEPSPLAAVDLLNAWFRADEKPERPDVNRLLRKVREIDLDEVKEARRRVVTKMLMSRAEEFLGESESADALTIEAFNEAAQDSSFTIWLWFDDVIERYKTDESDGIEESFAFLEEKADDLGTLPPIIRILVVRNEMVRRVPLERCSEHLEAISGDAQDDLYTKLEFHRLQNQLFYAMGRYEECAQACRAGLAISAVDLELNNNLAYTLAQHLGDPEAALPYAEAAANASPLNAAVLDTLGWVYFESGRYRDADRVLSRSLDIATTPDERVPALLHMAQTKNATGDSDEARKFIISARAEVGKASQMIQDQYTSEVDSLFQKLN